MMPDKWAEFQWATASVISQSFKQKWNPGPVSWCGPTHWEWQQGGIWVGQDPVHYLDRSISAVTPHLTEGEASDGLHTLLGWTLGWGRGGLWPWQFPIVVGKVGPGGTSYFQALDVWVVVLGGIPDICIRPPLRPYFWMLLENIHLLCH